MVAGDGYSWCPQCRKWVPAELMNYDYDDDDRKLLRVCTPCLDGTSDDNNYVLDEYFDKTQCMYCDSYNTVEQAPNWRWYKCNDCGATFRRM